MKLLDYSIPTKLIVSFARLLSDFYKRKHTTSYFRRRYATIITHGYGSYEKEKSLSRRETFN